jgi:hypothetical protein
VIPGEVAELLSVVLLALMVVLAGWVWYTNFRRPGRRA